VQYVLRVQPVQSLQPAQPVQSLQPAQRVQYAQSLQPAQRVQLRQRVQSMQLSQLRQFLNVERAARAASSDPKYSTDARLPFSSVIHVVICISPLLMFIIYNVLGRMSTIIFEEIT